MRVTSTTDGRPLSSASASPTGPGPPTTAGPYRDTGTGGSSAPHFPTVPSLAADDATVPVTSTATILTASPSLDATVDTVAGATATATSTAGVGMEVDTDPVPITPSLPLPGAYLPFSRTFAGVLRTTPQRRPHPPPRTLAAPPLLMWMWLASAGAYGDCRFHHRSPLFGSSGRAATPFRRAPLAADDATVPVTSTVTILTASPSLDATVDTVAGATATATSTAGVGMEVDTDPVPITTVPPTAGRISSFLSYIRRSVADDATATAASAAGTLATPPSPDVDVDATEGATANAASAAAASLGSSDSSASPRVHSRRTDGDDRPLALSCRHAPPSR